MIKAQTSYFYKDKDKRKNYVIIFPHRNVDIGSMFGDRRGNYDTTGKYFIQQETIDPDTKINTVTCIANQLSLKEARAMVAKLIENSST